MSQFATRFKHRQHTENITDDDECPIHLFNYPCCHRADIGMRSHRFFQVNDNKSATSCQQACYKLIVKTFYQQVWCKLFQQLTASLQISSCNKSDFHKLAST